MNGLKRRLDALEKPSRFITIGDLLDHLAGEALPDNRPVNPGLIAALEAVPGGGR